MRQPKQRPAEGASSYEEKLTNALLRWRSEVAAGALGVWTIDALGMLINKPDICVEQSKVSLASTTTELLVQDTLRVMLRDYKPLGAMNYRTEGHILEGLLMNERWRAFVRTSAEASQLVSLVLRYVTKGSANTLELKAFDVTSAGAKAAPLQKMLTTWLSPTIISSDSTLRDFSRALFGDAWCAVIAEPGVGEVSLVDLIRSTRPPFRPALISDQESMAGLSLPTLT